MGLDNLLGESSLEKTGLPLLIAINCLQVVIGGVPGEISLVYTGISAGIVIVQAMCRRPYHMESMDAAPCNL